MINTVIFDFDGVIGDNVEVICKTLNVCFKRFNISALIFINLKEFPFLSNSLGNPEPGISQ